MNLIIVESPTKSRTLSRFLSKDYSVEATVGHIKDLPKSKLGIDVEKDFFPDYELVKDKSNLESYVQFVKRGQRLTSISDDMVKEMFRRRLITAQEYRNW